jgi:hypothetical protein
VTTAKILYVGLPVVLVIGGYIAVRLHEWSLRHPQVRPGEQPQ